MAGAKKQHYVPQLYLRNFANVSGHLFVFDKVTRRSYPSSVRDAGHENHFLTIPELDGSRGPGSHFEEQFQQVEGPAAEVLANTLVKAERRERIFLDERERDVLARFLAVQYLRTPEARARVIETQEGISRALMSMIADNNDLDLTSETLKDVARVPIDRHSEVHAQFGLSPALINQVTEVLRTHVWRVMINRTEAAFYTSDNPLAFHCHVPRPGRGVGIGTYGVEVAFPLSPRLTLCLVQRDFARECLGDWERLEGTVGDATTANVEYYRWMQIVSSRRFLFAGTDEFSFATKVCEEQPALCEADRQRMEIWAGGKQL